LIIEAIKGKKGKDIVVINLMNIIYSPCSFFVICTGKSQIQINAITNNIEKVLKEVLNLIMWKKEGKNSNWQILDYVDIVVHVFKEETRTYYNLEELWGDGEIEKIN